ncbi:response regulator [Candidatus Saccharibacteria bacterium]|nr:response regulator [Candidatus Saccharibacteria bacterium]
MPPKVLLIDDDDMIIRLYDRVLSNAGFIVDTARDGTIVAETIKYNRPDIILMDVMMPNFNGLDTLKELKSKPLTSGLPIVMFSAYDDKSLIKKTMEYGAEMYLLKSENDPDEVVDILNKILNKNKEENSSVIDTT